MAMLFGGGSKTPEDWRSKLEKNNNVSRQGTPGYVPVILRGVQAPRRNKPVLA